MRAAQPSSVASLNQADPYSISQIGGGLRAVARIIGGPLAIVLDRIMKLL
jgi:hypothetical protein